LHTWNSSLINNIFSISDASAICGLPLHTCNLHDTRVWHHSADGIYTVKSAYTLCMSLEVEANVSPTVVTHNWNIIWKQHVPPRVRSLLWRMAHCCLPTRTRLIEKGVPVKDTCAHCDVLDESHIHSFFVCPKAMNCWEQVRLDGIVRELLRDTNDFTSLLCDFFSRL
jgi:hypothetical protein